MPVPNRIHNVVYILVPHSDSLGKTQMLLGRIACRVAYQMNLIPIFPALFCAGFMTEEELGRRLRAESKRWMKKSSRIWFCNDDSPEGLDPLSHDILLDNEGLMLAHPRSSSYSAIIGRRVPVYQFEMGRKEGDVPKIWIMDRLNIAELLRKNITSGLFRGVEI